MGVDDGGGGTTDVSSDTSREPLACGLHDVVVELKLRAAEGEQDPTQRCM